MLELIADLDRAARGQGELKSAIQETLRALDGWDASPASPMPSFDEQLDLAAATSHAAAVRSWVARAEARAIADVARRTLLAAADGLEPDDQRTLPEACELAAQAVEHLLRAALLDHSLRTAAGASERHPGLPSLLAETMAHMTYPDVERAAAEGAIVLLPTGVIEEHGPHLPLGVDTYAATLLCRLIQTQLEPRVRALIAPPFYWGVNVATSGFGGSFRIRPTSAAAVLRDILDTLRTDGFSTVLIVDHHGDIHHNRMILDVVRAARRDGMTGLGWVQSDRMIRRLDQSGEEPHWVRYRIPAGTAALRLTGVRGLHAEETETALMAHWFPQLVDDRALAHLEPLALSDHEVERWREGGAAARRLTPLGYVGHPRPADPDLWRMYEYQADGMAAAIVPWLAALAHPDSG